MADEFKAADKEGTPPNPSDGTRTGEAIAAVSTGATAAPAGAITSDAPRPGATSPKKDEETPHGPPPPFLLRHFHAILGGALGAISGLALWFTGTDWKLA